MATGDRHFSVTGDENYKSPLCNHTNISSGWSNSGSVANTSKMKDGWYRVNIWLQCDSNDTQNMSWDFGSYIQYAYAVGESRRIPYSFSFVVKIDKGYGNTIKVSYPANTYAALFHTFSFQYLGAL